MGVLAVEELRVSGTTPCQGFPSAFQSLHILRLRATKLPSRRSRELTRSGHSRRAFLADIWYRSVLAAARRLSHARFRVHAFTLRIVAGYCIRVQLYVLNQQFCKLFTELRSPSTSAWEAEAGRHTPM